MNPDTILPLVDLTVIGGGPVGLYGAFYGGLRGMKVRLIDSLPALGGQMRALYPDKYIYDMPGFPKVLAKDLADRLEEQAARYHPEVLLNQTAKELIAGERAYTVVTEAGLRCPTKTVLITAGAGAFTPKEIGAENEKEFVGKGLFYSIDNRADFEGKRIAVIGGGDSACDWALNLEQIASKVTLIHRRNVFKAHESTIDGLHRSKVNVKLWSVVRTIFGNGALGGIEIANLKTHETERLDVDAVLVKVGFRSALGYVRDWGIEIDRNHVKVGPNYQTNLKGVFAAGDICDYPGKLKLIATGVGEAATAVCFAKVQTDPFARVYPGHSSDQGET